MNKKNLIGLRFYGFLGMPKGQAPEGWITIEMKK